MAVLSYYRKDIETGRTGKFENLLGCLTICFTQAVERGAGAFEIA